MTRPDYASAGKGRLTAQSDSCFLHVAHILSFKIKLMSCHIIEERLLIGLYSKSFFELQNTKRHFFPKVSSLQDRHFSRFNYNGKFDNFVSFFLNPTADKS